MQSRLTARVCRTGNVKVTAPNGATVGVFNPRSGAWLYMMDDMAWGTELELKRLYLSYAR